jgi:hypothetical protein
LLFSVIVAHEIVICLSLQSAEKFFNSMGRGTELAFNVQTLKKLAAETLTLDTVFNEISIVPA